MVAWSSGYDASFTRSNTLWRQLRSVVQARLRSIFAGMIRAFAGMCLGSGPSEVSGTSLSCVANGYSSPEGVMAIPTTMPGLCCQQLACVPVPLIFPWKIDWQGYKSAIGHYKLAGLHAQAGPVQRDRLQCTRHHSGLDLKILRCLVPNPAIAARMA